MPVNRAYDGAQYGRRYPVRRVAGGPPGPTYTGAIAVTYARYPSADDREETAIASSPGGDALSSHRLPSA